MLVWRVSPLRHARDPFHVLLPSLAWSDGAAVGPALAFMRRKAQLGHVVSGLAVCFNNQGDAIDCFAQTHVVRKHSTAALSSVCLSFSPSHPTNGLALMRQQSRPHVFRSVRIVLAIDTRVPSPVSPVAFFLSLSVSFSLSFSLSLSLSLSLFHRLSIGLVFLVPNQRHALDKGVASLLPNLYSSFLVGTL